MVDGVVVIGGVTADVAGAWGATVSVMVAPDVTADVVTGPGGAGSGVSAVLTSLNVMVSAPMASTAVAPAVAEHTLSCLDFTSDHSISVSGSHPDPPGRCLDQFEEGSTIDLSTDRVTEHFGGETWRCELSE